MLYKNYRKIPTRRLQRLIAMVEQRIKASEALPPDQQLKPEELVSLLNTVTEMAKVLEAGDRLSEKRKKHGW
jgi:hypothetical protein